MSNWYDILTCPLDGTGVVSFVIRQDEDGYDEGCLLCPKCETLWSISHGIPRFVTAGNIDLNRDIDILKSLQSTVHGVSDSVIRRNVERLSRWHSNTKANWERDEMSFWESDYSNRLTSEKMTYNRLFPRQRHILNKLPSGINRVLELGCGHANTLFYDEQFIRNKEYIGTDLSFNALRLARTRLSGHYVLCDANALPFPDKYFDAVLGFGVLHHLHNREAALEKCQRVLKCGGWLGFCEKLKTSDRIQSSRIVALAKRLFIGGSRQHEALEFVDGGELLVLLRRICGNESTFYYDYGLMRDILVKLFVDYLRVNSRLVTRGVILLDEVSIRLLAPVTDFFAPKQVTFVAQKREADVPR